MSLRRLIVIVIACVALSQVTGVAAAPPIAWQTGQRFKAALDAPLSATWKNQGLRSVLQQISRIQRVAILLDRRINPDTEITFRSSQNSLSESLEAISKQAGAGVSLGEDWIYVGPIEVASRVQTWVRQLPKLGTGRPREIRAGWNDFSQPHELALALSKQAGWSLAPDTRLEHDLWEGCSLPILNSEVAMFLITVQFDCWMRNSERGLVCESLPAHPTLTRRLRPKGMTTATAHQLLHEQIPALQLQTDRDVLLATGRFEELNLAEHILGISVRAPVRSKPVIPLSQRRFSLKADQVEIQQVITELEKDGIVFEWIEGLPPVEKVDLKTRVSLNEVDLDAEQFFTVLFRPVRVRFVLEGVTVQLRAP